MARLTQADIACWVIKSSRPPEALEPDWRTGDTVELDRCLRPSYRLALMTFGQPVMLWISGRDRPGVHAHGTVTGTGPVMGLDGKPVVSVTLTRLAQPVDRADLMADPATKDVEVLRMPAGSNPSWLSAEQYAAVLHHAGHLTRGGGFERTRATRSCP